MSNFTIEVVSIATIKPSTPTPPNLRTFNLSLIDQFYRDCHVTVLLFYPNSGDPLSHKLHTLKTSLSQTLAQFYPLAGRLDVEGLSSTVDCDDQGVKFVAAQVPARLSEFLRKPDETLLAGLLPCGVSCVERGSDRGALLAVQATGFSCGGVAVGACVNHKIADGISIFTFLKAWASEARGESPVPREAAAGADSLFLPVKGFVPMTLDHGLKDGLVQRRFVIDERAVEALRASETSGFRPTRFEAIAAVMWRGIVRARAKAGSDGAAAGVVQVDLRRRTVDPPLPEFPLGNFITAELVMVSGDMKLFGGAIRKAVRRVDREYVRRLIGPAGFGWAAEVAGELMGLDASVATYVFSSWCHFPVYETDYGWGEPMWAAAGKSSDGNTVILMDRKSDGGVEAWVTLPKEEMAELQKDEELQAFASSGLSSPSFIL